MTMLFAKFVEGLTCRLTEIRGRAQAGQTLVEYALILTVISIGALAALTALNGSLNSFFQNVANAL